MSDSLSGCPASVRAPRDVVRPGSVRRDALRRVLVIAAAILAHVSLAHTLHAQEPVVAGDSAAAVAARTVTVAGIVRDSSGRPLSGAEVRAGGQQVTLTDDDGRFVLTGVEPDTIQVLVRRIGYNPMDAILEAAAGLRVEIAVKLVPIAIELGAMIIEGERRDTRLSQAGFYERRKAGRGVFFDPEYLERIGGSLPTLLAGVPGVAIDVGQGGIQSAIGRAGAGGRCALNVFLDGMELRWMDEVGLDRLLHRSEIRAIEVYVRPTDVPVELYSFGKSKLVGGGIPSPGGTQGGEGSFADCGTLMIWSK